MQTDPAPQHCLKHSALCNVNIEDFDNLKDQMDPVADSHPDSDIRPDPAPQHCLKHSALCNVNIEPWMANKLETWYLY